MNYSVDLPKIGNPNVGFLSFFEFRKTKMLPFEIRKSILHI